MSFIVLAHRGSGSIFGEAKAPLRHSGEVLQWDTREEAQEEADRLAGKATSPNVWYSVAAASEWVFRS